MIALNWYTQTRLLMLRNLFLFIMVTLMIANLGLWQRNWMITVCCMDKMKVIWVSRGKRTVMFFHLVAEIKFCTFHVKIRLKISRTSTLRTMKTDGSTPISQIQKKNTTLTVSWATNRPNLKRRDALKTFNCSRTSSNLRLSHRLSWWIWTKKLLEMTYLLIFYPYQLNF